MCEKFMLDEKNSCAAHFSKRKIHTEFMRYSCCYSCCSSCCYSCCFSCCFSCCYSCSETFFSCAGFWPAVFSCAHGHKRLPVAVATGHAGHRPWPLTTACGHGEQRHYKSVVQASSTAVPAITDEVSSTGLGLGKDES